MPVTSLTKPIQILFLLFLIVAGLYFAKPFLVPLVIAGMFAMLFLPLCDWLEAHRFNRAMSSLVAVLCLVIAIAGIVFLLSWKVTDLAEDFGKMQEYVQNYVGQFKTMLTEKLGISEQRQNEMVKSSGSGNIPGAIMGLISGISGVLVDFILMIVYIFLLLFQRSQVREFVLKLTDSTERKKVGEVMSSSTKVTRQYISGLAKMIVVLWIMYGIGFSIVGVKNALFFAVLCGLLEIVPFVGNLTGTLLTVTMAVSQGTGNGVVIGVLVTYAVVQFLQTYVLEPLVVGAQVKINPLFTILALIAGELIWGIPGMVLAIPLAAIGKIIAEHSKGLKPIAFVMGEGKKSS